MTSASTTAAMLPEGWTNSPPFTRVWRRRRWNARALSPQEEELAAKTARLNELNALLNLDKSENEIVDGERGEEELSRSSDDRER